MINGKTVWLTTGGPEISIHRSHRIYEIEEENSEISDDEIEVGDIQVSGLGAEQIKQERRDAENNVREDSPRKEDELRENGVGQPKKEHVPDYETKIINNMLLTENNNELENIDDKARESGNIIEGGQEDFSTQEIDSDDGFDTDLESDEDAQENYLQEQKRKYISTCRRLDVAPVTTLLNSLTKRSLKLSHQGLGSKGIRAIASVLRVNTCITELDLSDNNISEDGIRTVAKMLRDNLYITDLDVSLNNLCNKGLEEFINILKESGNIKHLKLSQTGLRDRHMLIISDLIKTNNVIITLILSHNELSVKAGLQLGPAISINSKIRTLDLSWNHLRNDGAIAIGYSLRSNNSISCLNLAWNGFADNGAEAVGRALQVNTTLVELDLSYNRITEKGGSFIASGLQSNRVLKILKLNWNPLKAEGVSYLIDGLMNNCCSALTELQLKGVVVDHNCKSKIEEMSGRRPGIKIDVGGVTSGGPMFANVNQLRREIVEIIVAYLAKHRLRMLDLFNQWDKDKSLTLTRNEFRKGIKDCKIPITEIQLNFMLDWLDQDGNDEIEYNEFVSITEVE